MLQPADDTVPYSLRTTELEGTKFDPPLNQFHGGHPSEGTEPSQLRTATYELDCLISVTT